MGAVRRVCVEGGGSWQGFSLTSPHMILRIESHDKFCKGGLVASNSLDLQRGMQFTPVLIPIMHTIGEPCPPD
jgi:hypothetical protein